MKEKCFKHIYILHLHDILLFTISNSCIFIYHFDGLERKLVFSGQCGVLALVNEFVFVLLT